ncbi:hypothetical protein LA080_005779 [Diaporthe eres]|nr:hypothetical protein LA080_005779 [Diaporthe eres]
MKTTAFFTFIGAASALVARLPPIAGSAFEAPNTLIQYQRWCPVCETVALNQACIAKRASCQASNLMYVLGLPTLAPDSPERSPLVDPSHEPHHAISPFQRRSNFHRQPANLDNSVPDDAPECSERCSNTCQLSAVADSDFGYSCNATLPAAGAR